MHSSLHDLPNDSFVYLMQKPSIVNKVAQFLIQAFKSSKEAISRNDIDFALTKCDKQLFLQFRANKLTVMQLKTRSLEKQVGDGQSFLIYDDIKDKIEENDKNRKFKLTFLDKYENKEEVDVKDIYRQLENWETNERCMKSLMPQRPKKEVNMYKVHEKTDAEANEINRKRREVKSAKRERVNSSHHHHHHHESNASLPIAEQVEYLNVLKRRKDESEQEFQLRKQQARQNRVFKRYLSQHKQMIKSQSAFYSSNPKFIPHDNESTE